MWLKPLLLLFSLFGFDGMVNSCNYLPTDFHYQPSSHLQSKAVNKKVMIKVSLLSQENKLPPLGIPPPKESRYWFCDCICQFRKS